MIVRGEAVAERRRELLRLRLGTDSVPTPLLATSTGETSATFSPDGKWLAYVSTETGKAEVYVRPFPDVNARLIQVSPDGGAAPAWNPAGGELFYISAAGDMMAAKLAPGADFAVRSVDRLFTPLGFQGGNGALLYAPSPDGTRFLMLDITATPQDARGERLVVVQNFATELLKRVPR
jgi:serine/threonine-protein kinase